LTFTNALGKHWGNGNIAAPVSANTLFESSGLDELSNYFKTLYETPIKYKSTLEVISITNIAEYVRKSVDDSFDYGVVSVVKADTDLIYSIDGAAYSQEWEKNVEISNNTYSLSNYATIEYRIGILHSYSVTGQTITNSYTLTAKYEIHAVENKYPTKPWTITSGIKRVLDLAEPIYIGETPRFELNPIQALKWTVTPLPETTMTQCTLREQLQHIGNYVHSQARLGGYLSEDITYNNKTYEAGYYENMIFFDEYGNQEESTLQGKPYVANQIRHSINEYNTKIETNAQNVVNTLDYADGVVTSPDSLNFKTLRTDEVSVRLSESDCIIETELPIYDIISVKVKAYSGNGDNIFVDDNNEARWDITPFVFEAHEYSNLSSYGGAYPYSKKYAIYYNQGQKNLDGLFVKPTTETGEVAGQYWEDYSIVNILESVAPTIDWKQKVTRGFPLLSFQVSYIPFYETKYSHTDGYILGQERKLPFAKIYNQSENVIETRFYGENIKGVAQRLGNKEATRTYILGHVNDVPKTGTKLDGYYISQVVTEYMPLSIKCTVGLTENFNRLSQNVGINSTKRVAEVSEKQAYERNILLKEYICIGSEDTLPLDEDSLFANDVWAPTHYMLTGEDKEDYYQPLTVAVSEFIGTDRREISTVKTPIVSSAFGNCITFSWNMKDNYSAGTEVVNLDNGYWQKDVPYADYYGRAYYMGFKLFSELENATGLDDAMSCSYDGSTSGSAIRSSDDYVLRKDSREKIKMNIAVEFITNRKDIKIHSALARFHPFTSRAKVDSPNLPKVYFFEEKITFDKASDVTDEEYVEIEPAEKANSFKFNVDIVNEFKSWAIAYPTKSKTITVYDEDAGKNVEIKQYTGGEILISCNNGSDYYQSHGITEETLYIEPYRDKMKDYKSV
jgi:hypothetical protein